MPPVAHRAIQTFEVSLKAFIVHDGRALVVQEADTGYWELPGGRIDVGEERLSHTDVLHREVAEELGPAFRIEFSTQIVTWVRQRPTDQVFQFLVARVCRHISGPLNLSSEHSAHLWVTPTDAARLEFPPLSDYPSALTRLWALADGRP
jgi:8-oxo-dGTP pyrophosphatase MutT (NUDIX family)